MKREIEIEKINSVSINNNNNELNSLYNYSFYDFSENNNINSNELTKILDSNIKIQKNESFDNYKIKFEDIYYISKLQKLIKENEYLSSDIKNNSIHNNSILIDNKRTSKKREKRIRKKEHSKFEKDNIMKKINIHYISFIVKYVNFNIRKLISKKHPLFANLTYEFKKSINNSIFNKLKNMTIGEVLKNEASSKNKRNKNFQRDYNEKIYNSVYNILKDLLDINYIDFFHKVYAKPSTCLCEINKIYKAPQKIIYFEDFIKKEMEKDNINGKLYKERLNLISKKEFINKDYPVFKTKLCGEN